MIFTIGQFAQYAKHNGTKWLRNGIGKSNGMLRNVRREVSQETFDCAAVVVIVVVVVLDAVIVAFVVVLKQTQTMRVNYENSLICFCHYSLQQMLLLLLLVLTCLLLLLLHLTVVALRRTRSLNSLLCKQADAVFVFVDEARFATYNFCCHSRCC